MQIIHLRDLRQTVALIKNNSSGENKTLMTHQIQDIYPYAAHQDCVNSAFSTFSIFSSLLLVAAGSWAFHFFLLGKIWGTGLLILKRFAPAPGLPLLLLNKWKQKTININCVVQKKTTKKRWENWIVPRKSICLWEFNSTYRFHFMLLQNLVQFLPLLIVEVEVFTLGHGFRTHHLGNGRPIPTILEEAWDWKMQNPKVSPKKQKGSVCFHSLS